MNECADGEYMEKAPVGYNSTKGVGREGPDYNKAIVLPNGVVIPKGESITYPTRESLDHFEVVVADADVTMNDAPVNTSREDDENEDGGDDEDDDEENDDDDDVVHQNILLKGLQQPADSTTPNKVAQRIYIRLNYNEYIVYDESQVRMRYLVQTTTRPPKKEKEEKKYDSDNSDDDDNDGKTGDDDDEENNECDEGIEF